MVGSVKHVKQTKQTRNHFYEGFVFAGKWMRDYDFPGDFPGDWTTNSQNILELAGPFDI